MRKRESGDIIKTENRKGVEAHVPVSYTHLDVYKRQVFAKLGSDYKKPYATTVIGPEDFKRMVWPLPVESLLYVGRTTRKTLNGLGVRNIGQLAAADPEQLRQALGKLGPELRLYALGRDEAPVRRADEQPEVKSVGNGMTFRRDLVSRDDVAAGLTALSDEVAARLRAHGLLCTAVQVLIKDTDLRSITRQAPLPAPTHLARDIARAAQALVEKNWPAQKPIRMLTEMCIRDRLYNRTFAHK